MKRAINMVRAGNRFFSMAAIVLLDTGQTGHDFNSLDFQSGEVRMLPTHFIFRNI